MILKDKHQKLLNSDEFCKWRSNYPESYLTHVFLMLDSFKNIDNLQQEVKDHEFQFGYYDPGYDRITTFILKDTIQVLPDAEVFKEGENKLNEILIENVKISELEAVEKSLLLIKEKYKAHQPDKIIIILQNLGDFELYNITIVTKSFHILNIKINASSGDIISENLSSVFDLKKKVI